MIGIVIPAHNEERRISECLTSILESARHPDIKDQVVKIVVVLDACSDDTRALVSRHDVSQLSVSFKNVGKTRAVGLQCLLDDGVL